MSSPENTPAPGPAQHGTGRSPAHQRMMLLAAVAVILAIAGTYAASDSWSTAAGVLCGGGLALGLVGLAGRRATRRGADAGTAERVFSGRGDERDRRVHLTTLAVVGTVGFLASALVPVAVQLGLDPRTALGLLPYLFIVTGVVAFVVVDRRT